MPSILTSVCVLVGWLILSGYHIMATFPFPSRSIWWTFCHNTWRVGSNPCPRFPVAMQQDHASPSRPAPYPALCFGRNCGPGEEGGRMAGIGLASLYTFFSLHSNFWSHSHSRWSGFVRTGTRSSSVSWMKDWCSAKQLPLRIDLMVSVFPLVMLPAIWLLSTHSPHPRVHKNGRLEQECATPNRLEFTTSTKNRNISCMCCVDISQCY